MKKLFFLLFALLLILRLFSDHSQNYHYTGGITTTKLTLIGIENFERFGFWNTKFVPILKEFPKGTSPSSDEIKPYIYTQYPPGPWWIFSLPYLAFGHSELAARVLAILISLLGLFFAFRSVLEIKRQVSHPTDGETSNANLFLILLILLAFNPGFFLFADTLEQAPITEVLQWASLFWVLRYLFCRASLAWGILLYFLHVWISFDWLVPFFLIILYCLYEREGGFLKNPRPWILFLVIGFCLPLFLRVALNGWALGGFSEAVSDLISRAGTRVVGGARDAAMQYSFVKHAGKLFFGMIWFVGIPILLLVLYHLPRLWRVLKKQPLLFRVLLFWGIGSVSWQFLMPQSAMIHGYTQIHIANYCFLVASLSVLFFWRETKKVVLTLVFLHLILFGMVVQSEIVIPFLTHSSRTMVRQLCPAMRDQLRTRLARMKSSMVYHIRSELAEAAGSPPCNAGSHVANNVLSLYAYGVKSRLQMHPEP